ncbi:MAG TPA: hypothetical protein VFE13_09350 [Caulobacteraceae bacterium]|nr:hypothetical protein [Caulobacteraceae bacterium]
MNGLSEAKLEVVRRLIEQAPDAAVRNLLRALQADGPHDVGLTRVQQLLEVEADDRNARNTALAPIVALCAPSTELCGLDFPPRTLSLIWKALKQEAPTAVAEAKATLHEWRRSDLPPEPFDALCAVAARGLRLAGGAFEAAAASADQGGGRQALAGCLDIAPSTRAAMAQMPLWLGRMTGETSAKLRLIYRDVVCVDDDAGPRFFEMLTSHLGQPWQVLRVIAGVMDRPTDAYVAASELGVFGERVLADIDRRLDCIAGFRPTSGRQSANEAARTLHLATVEIAEIEQAFHLAPDGPWGARTAKQKRRLAETVDTLLLTADRAVGQALPLHAVRLGPRTLKGVPQLTHDPDPAAVEKAATLLTFIGEVRSSAPAGGFAASRAKVLETLALRLDTYVEDVLAEIHADDGADIPRARAFLEIAADLCGLARDEKSAQIVRRRAAAA